MFIINKVYKNDSRVYSCKVLSLLYLLLLSASAFAQSATVSAGGDIKTSNGSVSFSYGQVNYINASSGTSINQGVQQPYEIYILTDTDGTNSIKLFLNVYPNPTTDVLFLDINDYPIENIKYQLFDIEGKIILDNKILSKQTTIQTGNLASATYLLVVTDGNKEIKTFKIIKKNKI